jgi:proline dehydrogenase
MTITRSLLLWGSHNAWLEGQMKRRAFARRAVRRFLPGEDVGSALTAAEDFSRRGVGSVLTQLGENLASEHDADLVRDHYFGVLEQIGQRKLPALISVKPTQLGIDFDINGCLGRVAALVERAGDRRIWIDMEDSSYVDRTLDLFRQLRATYENIGVCLQAYLRRTAADLETLLPLNPAIRLVKGAYAEPPERAFAVKRDTDANFRALGARGPYAVRHPNGRPEPAGQRGLCPAGAGQLRRRLVPVVHAAPGGAARERLVCDEECLGTISPKPDV